MPKTKQECKEEINNLLGRKSKESFSYSELQAYEKYEQVYGGDPDWERKVANRIKEAQEEHKQAKENVKRFDEENELKRPQYKKDKEKELRDKQAKYTKMREDFKALNFHVMTQEDKAKHMEEFNNYPLWGIYVEHLDDMIKQLWRDDSGSSSFGDIARFDLSGLENEKYHQETQKVTSTKAEGRDLEMYTKLRHALGKTKTDFKKENVDLAVAKYTESKETFEKRNGWQQFWGKILPAKWYKPAEEYKEMKAYEEALNDVQIYPNAKVEEAPVPVDNTTNRQPLDKDVSENLQNQTTLDKQPIQTEKVIENGEKQVENVNELH